MFVGTTGCQRSAERAAPPGSPPAPDLPYDHALNDTARVLAGMVPEDRVRFAAITDGAAWRNYRREMDANWAASEDQRFARVATWRDRELAPIVTECSTLLYPFAGPDILNAYQFFPTCNTYVLFGLEHLGSVPALGRLSEPDAEQFIADLREALADLFTRNYFITSRMTTELSGHRLDGTLPVVLLMLARLDAHIVAVDRVTLGASGVSVVPAGGAATPSVVGPETPVAGVRVTFVARGSDRTQSVIYFRAQAENAGLARRPAVTAYLRQLMPATTFMKSASYLLADEQFSAMRATILDVSSAILQDDSGVPYRFFTAPMWQVKLFGRYSEPVQDFNYGYQPDLEAAYAREAPPPLPFAFGYHWRDGNWGVMLATRASAEAGSGSDR